MSCLRWAESWVGAKLPEPRVIEKRVSSDGEGDEV